MIDSMLLLYRAYNALRSPLLAKKVSTLTEKYKSELRANLPMIRDEFERSCVWELIVDSI